MDAPVPITPIAPEEDKDKIIDEYMDKNTKHIPKIIKDITKYQLLGEVTDYGNKIFNFNNNKYIYFIILDEYVLYKNVKFEINDNIQQVINFITSHIYFNLNKGNTFHFSDFCLLLFITAKITNNIDIIQRILDDNIFETIDDSDFLIFDSIKKYISFFIFSMIIFEYKKLDLETKENKSLINEYLMIINKLLAIKINELKLLSIKQIIRVNNIYYNNPFNISYSIICCRYLTDLDEFLNLKNVKISQNTIKSLKNNKK